MQVTGKTVVEYFFDPTLVIDDDKKPKKGQSVDDILLNSKHLFVPCKIVKSLKEDGSNNTNNNSGNNKKKNKGKKKRQSLEDVSDVTSCPALVKTADGTLYKVSAVNQLAALTSR